MAAYNGWGSGGVIFAYFGFFTIATNILGALAYTSLAAPDNRFTRFFARPVVNSAVTAAMIVVGLAYSLLLRRSWHPEGLQLVADEALQTVMPLLALAYWWFAVPRGSLRWHDALGSLTYPVAYTVYVLVRGEFTGRYPYNFLDVGLLGYGRVLMNATIGLHAFAAIALALVGVSAFRKGPPG